MQLKKTDLEKLSNIAIKAAREAGGLIASYRNKNFKISTKSNGSSRASQVVTEVDHLSQNIILKYLMPMSEFYDFALLTEEGSDDLSRLKKDYFWCIDPLDGTLSFIEAESGFSISIALVSREGIPVIGIIYDPVTNTLYHAIKDNGAFKNNKKWLIQTNSMNTFTFIIDQSFIDNKNYNEIRAKLESSVKKLGYKKVEFIQYGGAVMNACMVAERAPACYLKLPKKENGGGSLWDFAATACLFNEIGAWATDIYGEPLDLNRPDSTYMNHRGVLFCSDKKIAKILWV